MLDALTRGGRRGAGSYQGRVFLAGGADALRAAASDVLSFKPGDKYWCVSRLCVTAGQRQRWPRQSRQLCQLKPHLQRLDAILASSKLREAG